jgi:integrase
METLHPGTCCIKIHPAGCIGAPLGTRTPRPAPFRLRGVADDAWNRRRWSWAVVSRALRHSSISTAADVYAHLTPVIQKRAAGQMDTILAAPKVATSG